MTHEVATDGRVVLRSIEGGDLDALDAVLGDADVMRYGPGPRTREDQAAFIDHAHDEYRRYEMGPWAICTPEDPTLVGYCRLRCEADWISAGEIELGYRLATRAWGKGLATAATTLARDMAFQRFDARTLVALIDPSNTASIRVAERIGMSPTREIMLPGYDHPDSVYTLSPADWAGLTNR